MTTEERIRHLDRAQENIYEAVEHIRQAVNGCGRLEDSVETYIVGHLLAWAEGHNPYDESIPRIMESIEGQYDDPTGTKNNKWR